jgi:amidohydrolase
MMILQPGEETSEGAKAMLADGLYTRFAKPTHVLAFHDAAVLPAGVIGITPGYALANVDSVDITVRGVGGHGALPATTKDPIVLAARIVTTLQTLVSRENDPLNPAVVTVGSFHSGAKHNIISDEAKLQLTVRSYKPEVRKALLDGISRIARGEAIAAGIPDDRMPIVQVREEQSTPSTFNTERLSKRARDLFTTHFGADRTVVTPSAMVGEDFSRFYLADTSIESLLFWVGGTPKAKWDAAGGDPQKLPSLHSPFWAPDAEAVISTATEALTIAALDTLKKA